MSSDTDELTKRLRDLLGDEEAVRTDIAWLQALPFSSADLQGHTLRTQGHPFSFLAWPTVRHAYVNDLADGMRKRLAASLSYPLNFRDALDCDGHLSCICCGAYDWDVTDQGFRPFAPCPLRDNINETSITISVPSGKLSVGVYMPTYFHGRDEAKKIDFDGTPFRAWYETMLLARYGFAQIHLHTQAECLLYRESPARLVLSEARVKGLAPVAEIFTYMPQFAACDAEFFEPIRQSCRHAVRQDARFDTVEVVPGTYRVSLSHLKQPPRILVGSHRLRPRIIMERIGPATPIPPLEALRFSAEVFLDQHPWLLKNNMTGRFALRDSLSQEK